LVNFIYYFFLLGLCVRADPAAVLAVLLALLLFSVFEDADPDFLDVTFLGVFVCDRAESAADLAFLLAVLFFKILEAAEAAFLLVTSLFAIAQNSFYAVMCLERHHF